ncbi:MAG: hydantoinase/oxoprolinase family protein [Candidatus Bathyarchaeota archaeon]
MVRVLGLDIGGVNIKAALIETENNTIKELRTVIEYFPIWKVGKEKLPSVLIKLRDGLSSFELNAVGVTMTAELSDVYLSKREGVNHIIDSLEKVFGDTQVHILDVEASLITTSEARTRPLDVAAANWSATGWLGSQIVENGILIDVGSTTTSIIPIIANQIVAQGKSDLDKLVNGELIYTGALRTNIATIVGSIPIRGKVARVSSEFFASSGDVHLILGNIQDSDYTVETADGRGKTKEEAMSRIAKVVCADTEMLTRDEIFDIARHIEERQIIQIIDGVEQVCNRMNLTVPTDKISLVVAGLGRNFLAKKATQRLIRNFQLRKSALSTGFDRVIDLGEIMGSEVAVLSSSFAIALMTVNKLIGEHVRWLKQ